RFEAVDAQLLEKIVVGMERFARHFKMLRGQIQDFFCGLLGCSHCLILRKVHAARRLRRGRISFRVLEIRACALRISYAACKFIQNSSLVPKKRASRRAVSAVIPRLSRTMSFTRGAGTRICL